MDYQDNKILTKSEIKMINTLGASKLDETGNSTYIIKFAFNDQKNQATDPIPFRIATEALDKIAKTGIGRPYVHNPGIKNNVGEHVRGPVDDPKKIVEYQKKFALGLIESTIRNPETNNVYAVINLFDEYVEDVNSGKIPLPTSPLLEPIDMKGDTIYDANWLHLQAVKSSGYPMELTQKLGMCQGMLNECATHLRTLGSSRQLKKFQNQFSYSKTTVGSAEMPDDTTNGPQGSGQMSVDDMVKNHDKMLADHGKMLEDHGKTLGSMKESLDQVLKNTSGQPNQNYPGTDGSRAGSTGAGMQKPTYGSAGETVTIPKEELDTLKSSLDTIKTEWESEKKSLQKKKEEIALKQRTEQAKIIANGEVFLKEITIDKVDERVKKYVELKDTEGKLVDLSLLAEKFNTMKKNTLGSSGAEFESQFPSLETTVGASGADKDKDLLLSMTEEFTE